MDTDRLNRWFKFCANVGVLIGLVILILEIRQSSAIAEGQFYMDQVNLNETVESAMLGDSPAAAWERSVFEPASLSPADIRIMDAYLSSRLSVWVDTLELERRGFLEPGSTAANIDSSIAYFFGNTFAQTWWSNERETEDWGDRLETIIDAAMLKTDPTTTLNRVSTLQGKPRE